MSARRGAPNHLTARLKDATVFLVFAVLYLIGASWTEEQVTRDSLGAALPAWSLVEHDTLELSGQTRYDAWIADTGHGYYSTRTPGLIAVTTLGYLVSSPFVTDFVVWPSTAMAVATSLGTLIVVAVIAAGWGRPAMLVSVIALGAGSALWGIAADEIWPHGPATLMVALALLSISRGRLWLGGVFLGFGILIRPPIAVIALILGVGLAISRRSSRPLLAIGGPSIVGAALLLFYNWVVFHSWSPTALYTGEGALVARSIGEWATNVALVFFSPKHGLFVWSSWILIALVFSRGRWKTIPDWARWAVLASLIFLLVHVAINRVSGGLPFNYRYPLEALVLATPVLAAWMANAFDSKGTAAFACLMVLSSTFLQAAHVFLAECAYLGTTRATCNLLGL
jgi:hypothetical protein